MSLIHLHVTPQVLGLEPCSRAFLLGQPEFYTKVKHSLKLQVQQRNAPTKNSFETIKSI